jgi:hypothetical protein
VLSNTIWPVSSPAGGNGSPKTSSLGREDINLRKALDCLLARELFGFRGSGLLWRRHSKPCQNRGCLSFLAGAIAGLDGCELEIVQGLLCHLGLQFELTGLRLQRFDTRGLGFGVNGDLRDWGRLRLY